MKDIRLKVQELSDRLFNETCHFFKENNSLPDEAKFRIHYLALMSLNGGLLSNMAQGDSQVAKILIHEFSEHLKMCLNENF